MFTARLFLVLLVACSAFGASDFASWARKYGKTYTAAEALRRSAIFARNAAEIEKLNVLHRGTAKFGLNQFSDLTEEEFAKKHLGLTAERQIVGKVLPDDVDTTVDLANTLPPVKNQGSCGSCWAFSTAANAEGVAYKNNGGVVVSLSEQQIIDCDKYCDEEGCYVYGCRGGRMDQADTWILKNNSGGLASEEDYPYAGDVTKCEHDHKNVVKFSSSVFWGKIENDSAIIEHLDTYGPLSIGVAAGAKVFSHYSSGIIDKHCGTALNHGVTLVGYGTDAETGIKYWKVRNSWGPDWGEEGYVRLTRGANTCGINTQISTIIA